MSTPLLGKRISLISKKNIRYEGVLYSINEQNATVALQNVRSFGTEGREVEDGSAPVAPSEAVHPYLLFRGQDIKDLHVHDDPAPTATKEETARTETTEEQEATEKQKSQANAENTSPPPTTSPPAAQDTKPAPATTATTASTTSESKQTHYSKQAGRGGRGRGRESNNVTPTARRPRKKNDFEPIGTGASLLKRSARGVVQKSDNDAILKEEFDFQSNLEQFNKEKEDDAADEEDEAGDTLDAAAGGAVGTYEKDDFFDSISCDALDRESGVDNRLRGRAERQLNTETFGAVALNTQRRRRMGAGERGGNPGGRGGGRGRGRGRTGGRGRGRGGRGYRNATSSTQQPQTASN